MSAREYLIHLWEWLRYYRAWIIFPRFDIDEHTWTRRVDPDMEPDYTCLVCGHVISEMELDSITNWTVDGDE